MNLYHGDPCRNFQLLLAFLLLIFHPYPFLLKLMYDTSRMEVRKNPSKTTRVMSLLTTSNVLSLAVSSELTALIICIVEGGPPLASDCRFSNNSISVPTKRT